MTKLALNFLQEPEKLWVRVHQSKYFRETNEGFIPKNKSIQSPLSKGLTSEWDTMLRGARSAIRNGKGTTFWTARWVDSGERLIDLVEDADLDINLDECVADFTTPDDT
ncbi:hypothetical protein LINPERHAP2_LOCUS16857 [Linum perenne]